MAAERWIRVEVALRTDRDGREVATASRHGRDDRGLTTVREAAIAALLSLGGAAVQEEGDRWITYLPRRDAPADPEAEARRLLASIAGPERWTLRVRTIADRDWRDAWKRGLGPRRVGDRWLVVPSWAEGIEDGDRRILRIDPGAAFGTGEHGTTRGMLRLLEGAVNPGDRVLDVGTGSGVLAAAAALLGAARVVAVEKDSRALETARDNVRRNGVGERVRLAEAEVTADFLRLLVPPRYQVVAANLSRHGLRPLWASLRRALAAEGRLLVSGVLCGEVGDALDAARAAGLVLVEEDRDEGWWSGRLESRRDI